MHFPVLLPLPVGLPSLGPAGGGDLWEMPAGVLQETPQNVGDLDFSLMMLHGCKSIRKAGICPGMLSNTFFQSTRKLSSFHFS